MKKSGIYLIRNLTTLKVYVGSAVNINNRWSGHRKDLKSGNHDNSYLQHSWDKYGIDSFEFVIIEEITDKSKLIDREQYWLDFFRAANKDFGYNLSPTAGNNLGCKYKGRVDAKMYLYKDKEYDLKQLAEIKGCSHQLIRQRMKLGWTIDEAMEIPLGQEKGGTPDKMIEYDGKTWTMIELCKHYNIKKATFWQRYVKLGYTVEEALHTKSHAKSGRKPVQNKPDL